MTDVSSARLADRPGTKVLGPNADSSIRFAALWQTKRFFHALDRLTLSQPKLRAKVLLLLQRYLVDAGALQRSPLHNPRQPIFHTRVDQGKRLIDQPLAPEHPGEVAMLFVGLHDEANEFGASYAGDTIAALATAVRVAPAIPLEDESTHVAGLDATTAQPDGRRGTYGEYLSPAKLRRLGVPDDRVANVRESYTSAGLDHLTLDDEVADRVESSYLSALPATAIAMPVPGPDEAGAIRVAAEMLPSLMRMPLARFLATMTAEQRALAERPGRRLYVVRGAAGTGKTIVGVRRVEHLLKQRPRQDRRPILYACYNQVLAESVRQMLADTLGSDPAGLGVEVSTAYRLLGRVSGELALSSFGEPVSRDRLEVTLGEARREAAATVGRVDPLGGWTDAELLDEMIEVIYGRALTTLAGYLEADRAGRSKPLDDSGRDWVWQVFAKLRLRCRQQRIGPWEQIPARVALALRKQPVGYPRYYGVVVDEAQDLTPSVFQALLSLQAGNDDNMLVLGDAAQNVYRSGFRWQHTGLRVEPSQVATLRRSFRSTATIVAAATPLVSGQGARFGNDLVLPEAFGEEAGPSVRVRLYASAERELEATALSIAELVDNGSPASSIAVLSDSPAHRRRLAALLGELEIAYEEHAMGEMKSLALQAPSVKLLSVGSAKGLEFQILFVPGVTEARFPSDGDADVVDRARRQLYTAMTRAAWELTLSAVTSDRSKLLDLIDARCIDLVSE